MRCRLLLGEKFAQRLLERAVWDEDAARDAVRVFSASHVATAGP